jgi:hypothetical protein
MEYFTVDGILKKGLVEFIGTWNLVLKLKGDWYQIPFTDLDHEFPGHRFRFRGLNPLEANLLIDEISHELLYNWSYFEHIMAHNMIEQSKVKTKR